MLRTIKVKKGATLKRVILLRNAKTKEPVDLTGQNIYCSVKTYNGSLVANCTVSNLDQMLNKGKALVDFGPTDNWPSGKHVFDFAREVPTDTGVVVVYSKTAQIEAEQGVTDV